MRIYSRKQKVVALITTASLSAVAVQSGLVTQLLQNLDLRLISPAQAQSIEELEEKAVPMELILREYDASQVVVEDNQVIFFDGNGKKKPALDGIYRLPNRQIITVENGEVTSSCQAEFDCPDGPWILEMPDDDDGGDGGDGGDESIPIGQVLREYEASRVVFKDNRLILFDRGGEVQPAPDGVYQLPDRQIITVEDGKVTSSCQAESDCPDGGPWELVLDGGDGGDGGEEGPWILNGCVDSPEGCGIQGRDGLRDRRQMMSPSNDRLTPNVRRTLEQIQRTPTNINPQ